MKQKLTKRVADSIRPSGSPLIVWDTDLKGFGLSLTATGAKSFVVQYRTQGGRSGTTRRLTLGRYGTLTVEEARALAKRALGGVAKGEDPAGERQKQRRASTLRELVDRYVESLEGKKRPTTAAEYARILKVYVIPAVGARKVAEISPTDVDRLHRQMKATPAQANRTLAVLSAMLTWATKSGLRDPALPNPCVMVEWYPERARERFLSASELRRLGDALIKAETTGLPPAPNRRRKPKSAKTAKHRPKSADEPLPADPFQVAAIRLLMLTGARRNEILKLRWDEVDLERGILTLGDSKTGRSVRPIGAPAVQLLASLPRLGEHVLPGRTGEKPIEGLRRLWDAVRHEAELPEVRLHDLRHTMASVAAGEGQSLLIIGKVLGHKRAATTQRYAHLADDPVKAAADKTAGTISALLSGSPLRAHGSA
jgi:integrase